MIIVGTSGCFKCTMLKKLADKAGVVYTYYDADDYDMEGISIRSFPVVIVDNTYLGNFEAGKQYILKLIEEEMN